MRRILILLAIICFPGSNAIAQTEENVAGAIESVVMENLSATQAEDTDRMMRTIHTQSPCYLQTKQGIVPLFENFDLTYNLLSFSYIGLDGEYAVSRVKQETTKVSGPTFQNNEMDMIQVFRKEGGKWMFWSQVILDIKFTNE